MKTYEFMRDEDGETTCCALRLKQDLSEFVKSQLLAGKTVEDIL